MEGNAFDRITKGLAATPSRRGLLAGVIGAAVALTGASGAEAKQNNRNRRRNGNNGNNGNNGQGAGTEKVQICHRNNGRRRFSLISVGRPAVRAHRRHGDTICPVPPECFVITGCDDDGACVTEPDEGASCDDFFPAAGVCNAEGECEELPISGGG